MDKETKEFLRGLGIFGGITALICLLGKALAAAPPEPKPELYWCPYCIASFSTQAELDEHIASMHAAPPPPPGMATLYGYVSSYNPPILPMPIEGVLVEVVGTGLFNYTDLHGNYEIANIPAGTYTIRFSHPNYQALETTIVLKPEVMRELRVSLTPKPPEPGRATVYGKITDARTGKPLQDIMAQFNGHQTGTDKSGRYQIELPAGTYFTVRFYDWLMRYETKELLIPLNLADGQVKMLNVSLRSLIPD